MGWKITWFIIIAVAVGYEIFTTATNRETLTDITTEYLPWFLVMPFVSWLWVHFVIHYSQLGKFPMWLVKFFTA